MRTVYGGSPEPVHADDLPSVSPSAARDDGPQSFEAFERDVRRSREFARPTGQYGSLDDLDDDPDDDPEDLDLEALDAPGRARRGRFASRASPSRWRRGATRWRRSAGAGARPRRPRPGPPSRSSRRRCSGSASRFSCPRSPAASIPNHILPGMRFALPIARDSAAHDRQRRGNQDAHRRRRRARARGKPAAIVFTRAADPATNAVVRARFCSWPSLAGRPGEGARRRRR